MDPFDQVTAKLDSRDKFEWTPGLIAAFNKAQSHLEQVNALTLPSPEEICGICVLQGKTECSWMRLALKVLEEDCHCGSNYEYIP